MRLILISLLIFLDLNIGFASEMRDIIHDPAVSRRCKALLEQRTEKIRVQQKLNSLILRNQKLDTKVHANQKSIRNRLSLNLVQLKNNLRLIQMRIKSMEENIVRKGCPGLTL